MIATGSKHTVYVTMTIEEANDIAHLMMKEWPLPDQAYLEAQELLRAAEDADVELQDALEAFEWIETYT